MGQLRIPSTKNACGSHALDDEHVIAVVSVIALASWQWGPRTKKRKLVEAEADSDSDFTPEDIANPKDNHPYRIGLNHSSHGSSSSCLAVLRSSGSHLSMDLIK